MEFLIANSNREDLGVIHHKSYLDIDVGNTNDFLLKERLAVYDPELYAAGHILYCLGTEYGGVLHDPESSTKDGYISFSGDTFRGMMEKKFIEPPAGSDFKTISGDLNTCLKNLVGEQFGQLFAVSDTLTEVSVIDYQFKRYCSLLDGITEMLASVNYRLNIECMYDEIEKIVVMLSAVPVVDHSEEIEMSQDSKINFTIKQYTNLYNYMLCLGSGELAERMVVRLHLLEDGTVEEVDSFPNGFDVRIYQYDYSSAESKEVLIEEAVKKFIDINSTNTQKLTIADDMQLELGDIIGGRDYVTGMYLSEKITQKIVKIQNETLKISYKVGDGD